MPDTLQTRAHKGLRHILTDKSRAFCKARLDLNVPVEPLPDFDTRHPQHPEHVPEDLCPKCRTAWTTAQLPVEEALSVPEVPPDPRAALREAVSFAYDLQKLRIQQSNRGGPQAGGAEVILGAQQVLFLRQASLSLELLEKDAFKEVERQAKTFGRIYDWMRAQKGCGPVMAGVILAYVDIHRAPTVSSLWKWCGLAVVDGHADRREKGKKAGYNPWLKSKMLAVLGESFIKTNSPWRKHYDDNKHRLQHRIVQKCMLCDGSGTFDKKPCGNCNGTGGPCAWGRSDAHRHRAALRYMVKMFVAALWTEWRTIEGLEIRAPYMEQYLGRAPHHDPATDVFRPHAAGADDDDDDDQETP